MTRIEISELRPIGSDLFQDSETFLNELSEQEMAIVEGGLLGLLGNTLANTLGDTFGYGGLNLTGPDSAQSLINLQQLLVISGVDPNA